MTQQFTTRDDLAALKEKTAEKKKRVLCRQLALTYALFKTLHTKFKCVVRKIIINLLPPRLYTEIVNYLCSICFPDF